MQFCCSEVLGYSSGGLALEREEGAFIKLPGAAE